MIGSDRPLSIRGPGKSRKLTIGEKNNQNDQNPREEKTGYNENKLVQVE
jgi:hypothetical protein